METLIDRIETFIWENESGCWNWKGNYDKGLRPRVFFENGNFYPYRVLWEDFNNQKLNRRILWITCNNACCVNPQHHVLRKP